MTSKGPIPRPTPTTPGALPSAKAGMADEETIRFQHALRPDRRLPAFRQVLYWLLFGWTLFGAGGLLWAIRPEFLYKLGVLVFQGPVAFVAAMATLVEATLGIRVHRTPSLLALVVAQAALWLVWTLLGGGPEWHRGY